MRKRAQPERTFAPPRRARRSVPRQWCVPPAITTDSRETIEGTTILAEHGPSAGHLLWIALREVTLWAQLQPDSRAGFLADRLDARLAAIAEGGLDRTLGPVLTALTTVVRSGAPDPHLVALLCANVSDWAHERDARATALHFAQAAALAHPEAPAPALRVGTLALGAGQDARAETWLRRAVGLARRAGRWDVYAGAYLELGTLYRTRLRDPARAERYYVLAARAARRKGNGELVGSARHGLFLLRLDAGELDEAARLANAAGRAYGRGHPALPRLRRDLAMLWMRQGDHARGLRVLREILPTRTHPAEQLNLCALIARAAAEGGALEVYREHWLTAWNLMDDPRTAEAAAGAMLELARASAVMRDADRVRMIARCQPTLPPAERDPAAIEALLAEARRPAAALPHG